MSEYRASATQGAKTSFSPSYILTSYPRTRPSDDVLEGLAAAALDVFLAAVRERAGELKQVPIRHRVAGVDGDPVRESTPTAPTSRAGVASTAAARATPTSYSWWPPASTRFSRWNGPASTTRASGSAPGKPLRTGIIPPGPAAHTT